MKAAIYKSTTDETVYRIVIEGAANDLILGCDGSDPTDHHWQRGGLVDLKYEPLNAVHRDSNGWEWSFYHDPKNDTWLWRANHKDGTTLKSKCRFISLEHAEDDATSYGWIDPING